MNEKQGRAQLLELWNDMWQSGNWVPSWRDSLDGLTPEEAAWSPDAKCHSIWAEVSHVIFWREATIRQLSGGTGPTEAEVEAGEFFVPPVPDEVTWKETIEHLEQTQSTIAEAIATPETDMERIPYHLIHDAYHLGRVTHIRSIQGTKPKF